ncbi:MAG TPA: hypothetical protein VGC79_03140 [Polyangiaceae bacterium]
MTLIIVQRARRSQFLSAARTASVLATAILATACSGDGAADTSSAGEVKGPLYLVSTSVLTNDQATSYMTVVDSLAAGPKLGLDNALEFGGGARAYGPPKSDVVYVTSSEGPTLTEVRVQPNGTLARGRVLSFLKQGLSDTTGANVVHFISPTKAYFVSQETQEIVIWDPSKMAIVKTVSLELPLLPSSTFLTYYPRPIVVGNKLLIISNESNDDDIYQPPIVSVVDTERDVVVSSERDSRCPGVGNSAVDKHGDRYFAQDSYAVSVHFLDKHAPAPCMLRIRAGETAFDPDWSRTLDQDLGTSIWTGASPGADGRFYVQAIAETAPAVEAAEDPYSVNTALPWTWYSMSDGDAKPEPVAADYLDTPPLFPELDVGDAKYVTIWDLNDTTLLDLTSEDEPTEALQVRGFVYNVVQVR